MKNSNIWDMILIQFFEVKTLYKQKNLKNHYYPNLKIVKSNLEKIKLFLKNQKLTLF